MYSCPILLFDTVDSGFTLRYSGLVLKRCRNFAAMFSLCSSFYTSLIVAAVTLRRLMFQLSISSHSMPNFWMFSVIMIKTTL